MPVTMAMTVTTATLPLKSCMFVRPLGSIMAPTTANVTQAPRSATVYVVAVPERQVSPC